MKYNYPHFHHKGPIGAFIKKLEQDPETQYKFHLILTYFWLVTMFIVPFFPGIYGKNFAALFIQEISLWALVATHFGAMAAAEAAHDYTGKNADKKK